MAHYVDSLSILHPSCKADDILLLLSDVFKQHGLMFMPNTNIIFHDLNGQEREPELVSSETEALSMIGSWPSLGGTQYGFQGYTLSFFLYGSEDYYVEAITTSISSSAYVLKPEVKRAYDALVAAIHTSFKAIRTIAEHELLSPDSFWLEEAARIKNNEFVGSYAIDLR